MLKFYAQRIFIKKNKIEAAILQAGLDWDKIKKNPVE
jgi:hypothetical protein